MGAGEKALIQAKEHGKCERKSINVQHATHTIAAPGDNLRRSISNVHAATAVNAIDNLIVGFRCVDRLFVLEIPISRARKAVTPGNNVRLG